MCGTCNRERQARWTCRTLVGAAEKTARSKSPLANLPVVRTWLATWPNFSTNGGARKAGSAPADAPAVSPPFLLRH
jgi:hypothetical protein